MPPLFSERPSTARMNNVELSRENPTDGGGAAPSAEREIVPSTVAASPANSLAVARNARPAADDHRRRGAVLDARQRRKQHLHRIALGHRQNFFSPQRSAVCREYGTVRRDAGPRRRGHRAPSHKQQSVTASPSGRQGGFGGLPNGITGRRRAVAGRANAVPPACPMDQRRA